MAGYIGIESMEILLLLEGLIPLFDGCFCFLELATLFSSGTATYSGVKTFKDRKGKPELMRPSVWPFVILVTLAVGFTVLLVVKYTRVR